MLKKLKGVVAIDGYAGAGKSTVARLIAKKLGFTFLNTGDMYRALTWKALREKINIHDNRAISRFLHHQINWDFKRVEGVFKVFVDGKELGKELRSERVSRETPIVASIMPVRHFLRAEQAKIAARKRVVLEGRDTTTHVAPGAELKIFLEAAMEERAKRRYQQLVNEGKRVKLERIEAAIRTRDRREIQRNIMPKHRSPGTIVIDTTRLSLQEVADEIIALYKARAKHS